MSDNAKKTEMEIKLDLINEQNFVRLLEYFPEPVKMKHQSNYFFDSDNWDLSRSGWALRLRKADNSAIVTLKGLMAEDIEGLTVRPEIEQPLPVRQFEEFINQGIRPEQLPNDIFLLLKDLNPGIGLKERLHFTTDRHIINYMDATVQVYFEADRTLYQDGSTDYELEIEIEDRSQFDRILSAVREIFIKLNIPLKFQEESKFARALKKTGIDTGFQG